ncbi:MAG: flagellar hook-basal body complex protein FliE [Pseudomonadota bacterium]
MDKTSINSLMQEMRATAARLDQAHNRTALETPASGANFADALADAAKAVSGVQKTAAEGAAAIEAGVPGVALDEVMVQMQRADLSFRAMTEVRNKLVTAYQDIMNMPV